MSISQKKFGVTKNGSEASLYTLTNKNGMKVTVSDFGAVIVSIIAPDKDGRFDDVVLGYDRLSDYETNSSGYGSFIGRVANRISNASITIAGIKYPLEKNDGNNCLHSGSVSYNKFMYEHELYDDGEESGIEFSRLSSDGEQGFPGSLDVSVTYTLTDDNELVIEYFAAAGADTVLNFTNHSYFNLGGQASGRDSVMNEILTINADRFTPTDDALIPTGEMCDVTGTPMDFRAGKPIGADIDADYKPLKQGKGYDHNYVLNHTEFGSTEKVAEIEDPKTGRCMEVFTDLPGMQLYTANCLDDTEDCKGGIHYQKRGAVCFETQFFPNTVNTPAFKNFSGGFVEKGGQFESTTIYKFSVKN